MLQILEITDRVVVCVNLLDEAKRKSIHVNIDQLASELGIPVIGTTARNGGGLLELKNTLHDMVSGKIVTQPRQVTYDQELENLISKLENRLAPWLPEGINSRWVALRILERDFTILEHIMINRKPEKFPLQIIQEGIALCLQ